MQHFVEKILHIIFPPRDESGFFIHWKQEDYRSGLTPGIHHSDYTALFSYTDPHVSKLITSLKKEKISSIGNNLSKILAEEILSSFNEEIFIAAEKIYIVPIPISKKRRNERGFNQTEWIGKKTTRELGDGFIFKPQFLTKVRETEKQSTLSRTKRLKNPKGSFRASENLTHKKIILIDDVITTGATTKEAVRALKKSGATDITIFCIAH